MLAHEANPSFDHHHNGKDRGDMLSHEAALPVTIDIKDREDMLADVAKLLYL
jgi:hypothetical protein